MKKVWLCLVILFAAHLAMAQDDVPEGKGFQKEKLFAGGNFGLTFGDYTLINISPQIGYRFNRFLAAGVGINGQYVSIKQRDYYGNTISKVAQGVAGLNVFGRFYPFQQFMLQVQPEGNYIFGKQTYYQPREEFKIDAQIVPSLLMGGGLVLPAGRGAMIVSVMYDVLQRPYSPYGKQPIYNFGYNIGF
jgi:hypothetical protein